MSNPGWDPQLYGRYADERSLPFFDLVARIGADEPTLVYDLGCGPGTQTVRLRERWPEASIRGIDLSAGMIEAARRLESDVQFEVGDIRLWLPPADTDVIVSNATLQWIPAHRELLTRWSAGLRTGAWLAFQVPGNHAQPSHSLMRMLADSSRWSERLGGVLPHSNPVSDPASYLELLEEADLDAEAWETTYIHVLTGDDPVLDWVRGTALRPVLEVLDATDAAEFEAEYAALLRDAYPRQPHGVVFPFRRIFCVGRKR